MIRQLSAMPDLVRRLLMDVETEVVEYKEAKNNYSLDKLGRYFSALGNEANLRHAECGWLLLGVTNNREICGTHWYQEEQIPSVGLRKLKHDVAEYTNERNTFEEIYEFEMEGKRVIAFQIPPAPFASPITWKGEPWSRENESLKEMPRFKLEAIYGQSRPDWSRQIAYEARYEDLDPEAIDYACKRFVSKFEESQPILKSLSQEELLRKMEFIIHDHITNAALVLLGKPESAVFLEGAQPRITWTLYDSTGATVAYEHFDPPFILQVDKVLGKIRNEKFRYFDREDTLFPTEGYRYTVEVIRELLHNAIAHQDYRLSGKVNVLEYEDRLVFKNEGLFIPGTIEAVLAVGYKPPYIRNTLLTNAMHKTGMIDQNTIGIRNVYDIQRKRLLPLPTYELDEPGRVSVTVFGRVLNEDYSRLLAEDHDLGMDLVFLLDMVQKGLPITKAQARALRDAGLVEGRYPNLSISSKVAGAIGAHKEYVKKRGLDAEICKELILKVLATSPCSRAEIIAAIDHALPQDLSLKQKQEHVSYLLKSLKRDRKIALEGNTSGSVWMLIAKDDN